LILHLRQWLVSLLIVATTCNKFDFNMPNVKMADTKSLTDLAESQGFENIVEDCEEAMFFSIGKIDGKEYSINGLRVNKSVFIAVICDESVPEFVPTSDITKLAEIHTNIFIRRAHIHRNKKLGYPDDHLRSNPKEPMYLELLEEIKRIEKKSGGTIEPKVEKTSGQPDAP